MEKLRPSQRNTGGLGTIGRCVADLSSFLVVDILPMLALGLVPPLQFSVPVCLERKITASASGQLHHTFGFLVSYTFR